MTSGRGVQEAVATLAEPVAQAHGLELVDVEFLPSGRRSVLRVYLDGPEGVTLDELSSFSREFSDVLDVHDVVPGAYSLECSSPGVNRPLRKPQDFSRFIGKAVRVRTLTPIEGARTIAGRLAAVSEEAVEVEDARRGRLLVPFSAIDRANYEHDFSEAFHGNRA
jgi:ribosome maturation factor RimP